MLLELPCVRAAAVSCLAHCAVEQPRLKHDIHLLLQRSLADEDDEVRDRVKTVTKEDKEDEAEAAESESAETPECSVLLNMVRVAPPPFSLHQLESSLLAYLNRLNDTDFARPFGDAHVKAFIEEETTCASRAYILSDSPIC